MPPVTLDNGIGRGWVHGRQQASAPHRWILGADPQELEGLYRRHQLPAGYYTRRQWLAAAALPEAPIALLHEQP
ncbi:MAG: hypothetical protein M1118_11130 [Chloroflexi bacterium]|nr:hypothetical protein [Chloroflexota bacterium]